MHIYARVRFPKSLLLHSSMQRIPFNQSGLVLGWEIIWEFQAFKLQQKGKRKNPRERQQQTISILLPRKLYIATAVEVFSF